MSALSLPVRSWSGGIGSAALLGVSLAASPAAAQDLFGVDLSARAGVSTNPFLTEGDSPAAFNGTLGIRPSWTSERPLTTLRVDGNAEVSFYDQGYGTNESVSVQGSGTHRLSEYTTISAALGYVNTIVGSFNGVGGYVGVPAPIVSPVVGETPPTGSTVAPVIQPDLPFLITDPSLGAIGRRRQSYLATGGIATALSSRDQLALNMAVSANRAKGTDIDDFNYTTPSISYSRALGERFSVGASFAVGFTDYLGTRLGDATIYQPALTLTRGFSSRWSLSASLGAAIVDTNGIANEDRTSTSFNGTASLCRLDERWSGCFNASRQTVPSSFQGVRTQTAATASLSYRISARDDVSFNAGYSRSGGPIERDPRLGGRDGSIDFVNATGNYSRRIAPALFGTLTLGYARAIDDGPSRDGNFTALAGVTYRLGRQR